MLKKCKVCGALNMESATTCVSCGSPLDGTQPVSATSLEKTGELPLPVVSIEEPETKEPVSIVTPLKRSIDDIKNRQGQEKKKPAQKPKKQKASQKNASSTPHAQNRERKKFQGIGYGTATLLGIVLGLILAFLVL